MKKISSYTTKNKRLGIRTHHDTYRCSHCYFTKELHWDENINSGHMGGAATGGALGGSFFGGGGRSFGGSFGGGSFGGGGASGHF